MNKSRLSQPLHERLRGVLSTREWTTLEVICLRLSSSSKSYVKVTLFAMPDVEFRRVLVKSENAPKNTWRWEFRLIEDMP